MKLPVLVAAAAAAVLSASATRPIYGVNLGSWKAFTGTMDFARCMGCHGGPDMSYWQLSGLYQFGIAYPDTVDEKFNQHWSSWFTQSDVDKLVEAGINTVRIPLGWWLVEPLVDRSKEYFPRGGFGELRRGLKQLKEAGIDVILDHHALPGVQDPGQEFTGLCTTDVEFYTPYNYHRALIWTAVMTTFTHILPEFCNVVAIEAVNEPIMDASKTPGYGAFQRNFVEVVRAIEFSLGIPVASINDPAPPTDQGVFAALNFTLTLQDTFNSEVISVLKDSIPVIVEMSIKYGLNGLSDFLPISRTPLTTAFMDINWQYNNPSNPADAAIGPQIYDNHLYYSFGGVADANPTAYLKSICNLPRIQNDAAMGNSPLVFGEWSLATQFEPTDDFLRQWADAQKLAYSKGAGWIFWNFKTENSPGNVNSTRVWSYFEGLSRGYLTKDPSAYFNPNVCDGF